MKAAAEALAEMPGVGQTAGGQRGDQHKGWLLLGDVLEHLGDEILWGDYFQVKFVWIEELLEEGKCGDFGAIAGCTSEDVQGVRCGGVRVSIFFDQSGEILMLGK